MSKVSLPKKPWLALFLSAIVIGLGQIYARKIKRGALIFIMGYSLFIIAISFWLWNYSILPVIPVAVFWLLNIYDAYKQVKFYNDQLKKKKPNYIR